MPAKHDQSKPPTLFEATISIPREARRRIQALDIDVLPEPERIEDDRIFIRAIVPLGQVKALVDAGAQVTLRRLIDPEMPPELIRSEDEVADRLRPLEPFREEGPEGAE